MTCASYVCVQPYGTNVSIEVVLEHPHILNDIRVKHWNGWIKSTELQSSRNPKPFRQIICFYIFFSRKFECVHFQHQVIWANYIKNNIVYLCVLFIGFWWWFRYKDISPKESMNWMTLNGINEWLHQTIFVCKLLTRSPKRHIYEVQLVTFFFFGSFRVSLKWKSQFKIKRVHMLASMPTNCCSLAARLQSFDNTYKY